MTDLIKGLRRFVKHILAFWKISNYPNVNRTAKIEDSVKVYNPDNFFVGEKCYIAHGAVIMNTRAKFIMKKNSGSAFGLSVITGGHLSVPGMFLRDVSNKVKDELDIYHEQDQDIVVEEDVWLGANVTILHGVRVGRGSVVGAGSVIRNDIPPYAIVLGNPAKLVGFRWTPTVIAEHERMLYEESDRIPIDILEENYNKYFVLRIKEIQNVLK